MLICLQKPKEQEWDAETILSTYTTTDNHPHLVKVIRRPKDERIRLHARTGLPVGIALPAAEERARLQAMTKNEEEDEGEEDDIHAERLNAGVFHLTKHSLQRDVRSVCHTLRCLKQAGGNNCMLFRSA